MATLSVEPNEHVTFGVRYEDEHLVVAEKPSGVVTQPGASHEHDSLLNGLFARWGTRLQQLGKARSFGLLHRLDRETSGLVCVALDAPAYDRMADAFRNREVRKFYWALVKGGPNADSGTINRPLAQVRRDRLVSAVSSAGKPALTAYRVLGRGRGATLLECRTLTGRLHQVRVHLASIHCPILGDGLYAPGPVAAASGRLALHAHRLAFVHPITGAEVDVRTSWPTDLKPALRRVGIDRPDREPPSG
jgi:23S rRNA pseudouridine1911/1915/1917 synthase